MGATEIRLSKRLFPKDNLLSVDSNPDWTDTLSWRRRDPLIIVFSGVFQASVAGSDSDGANWWTQKCPRPDLPDTSNLKDSYTGA